MARLCDYRMSTSGATSMHSRDHLQRAIEWNRNMSSVENPGWLFDIGDNTTQLYGNYNKPI